MIKINWMEKSKLFYDKVFQTEITADRTSQTERVSDLTF